MDFKTIISVLEKTIPELQAVYLFGSYADNSNNNESDVDLAFLTQTKISNIQRWEIQEKLAANLNQDVDLANVLDCSEVMKFQIIYFGKRIYCTNEKFVNLFENTTFGLYLDLKEQNALIHQQINQSGQIYG